MRKSIAIITGGSSGLGAALAEEMASKGHEVLIVARNASKLGAVAAQINDNLATSLVKYLAADISTSEGVKGIFNYIQKKNCHPAYLFNNAGVGPFFDLKDYQEEWIDNILNTNLKGSILLCAELLRVVENRPSTIINIVSSLALKTMPNTAVYAASKWGLRGFTKSLQDSTKGTNIRVMGVYPGRFKSAFWDAGQLPAEGGDFMETKDLARVIVENVLGGDGVFVRELVLGAW